MRLDIMKRLFLNVSIACFATLAFSFVATIVLLDSMCEYGALSNGTTVVLTFFAGAGLLASTFCAFFALHIKFRKEARYGLGQWHNLED